MMESLQEMLKLLANLNCNVSITKQHVSYNRCIRLWTLGGDILIIGIMNLEAIEG